MLLDCIHLFSSSCKLAIVAFPVIKMCYLHQYLATVTIFEDFHSMFLKIVCQVLPHSRLFNTALSLDGDGVWTCEFTSISTVRVFSIVVMT